MGLYSAYLNQMKLGISKRIIEINSYQNLNIWNIDYYQKRTLFLYGLINATHSSHSFPSKKNPTSFMVHLHFDSLFSPFSKMIHSILYSRDISRKSGSVFPEFIKSIGKLVVGLDGGNNSKPNASAKTFLSSSCK